jgi:hypothetical protein
MSASSCSYALDLVATLSDGELAFYSLDPDFKCVSSITVSAVGSARAEPSSSDRAGLVTNGGAFWWVSGSGAQCENAFPVKYGQQISRAETLVSPKPLVPGEVYNVTTSGDGAYGFGCFELTESGSPNNLPQSACNPDDAQQVSENIE